MKIKQISSLIVMLFACLANISGDKLEPLDKRRCRTLSGFEQSAIDDTPLMKNCYVDVRYSIVHGAASNAGDPILKEFRKIIANGTFDRLAGLSLESLIQGLGAGANLETKNLVEERIRLWFIREKISDSDSIDAGTLEGIRNFKTFHTTWKDLLGVIKAAKGWANRQPEGSDAVKLCDSFRKVPSEKSSSKISPNYAKVLADMLKNSPETWKFQPVVPAEEPANPFAEKPSSTSSMPSPSADRFASPNPSSRQDSYRQKNFIPQSTGDISAWTGLHAGAVANSARVWQDPISEMVTKFPLEDVLKGDKSTLEDFKSHLKTLPGYYLSKEDEYMGLPKDLTDFLNPLGYRAVATPGVGNCAFDAVLLSLLEQMGIYQPKYNYILGEYLEQQIPDFRKGIEKLVEDSKKDLKTKIQENKEWCDQDIFPFMAKKLQKKITLVYYNNPRVVIESYCPNGNIDISTNSNLSPEGLLISAIAEDSLLIAYNGVNHYVALMPSPQVAVVDEMVRRFSLRDIHHTQNVHDIKDFLYKLPPSCCSSQADEDKTIPDPLKRFLDSLGYIALTVPRNNLDRWCSLWMSFCIEQGIYHPKYNRILSEFITRKAETEKLREWNLRIWAVYFKRDILLISQDGRDEISISCTTKTNQEIQPEHKHQTNAEFFNAFASNNAIILLQDDTKHFTTVRQK